MTVLRWKSYQSSKEADLFEKLVYQDIDVNMTHDILIEHNVD